MTSDGAPRIFRPMLPLHPTAPRISSLERQAFALSIGYGAWLVIGDPFHLGGTSAFLYARTADEWLWCLMLLTGAAVQFLGVAGGNVRLRQLGLILVALVWLTWGVCVFAANPHLPGTWTHAVLAASAISAAFNLGRHGPPR